MVNSAWTFDWQEDGRCYITVDTRLGTDVVMEALIEAPNNDYLARRVMELLDENKELRARTASDAETIAAYAYKNKLLSESVARHSAGEVSDVSAAQFSMLVGERDQ